jgi:hypothetical protein
VAVVVVFSHAYTRTHLNAEPPHERKKNNNRKRPKKKKQKTMRNESNEQRRTASVETNRNKMAARTSKKER